jgi:predicted phage terminase large subunit-like protein
MVYALYQQHPTTDGGNIIRREWFNHISKYDFMKKHDDEPIHFFLDTAYTESKANDPSGIIGACKIGTNIYIVHGKKVNMNFPNLCRFLPDYMRSHGYTRQSTLRIEPKANGLSVIDQLRETTNLNVTRTPTPRDSKETRLNAISPYIESGRIYLVDDDWTDEFIEEVCGFPAQPHDEYVDVLCYAVNFNFGATMKLSDTEILQDFL